VQYVNGVGLVYQKDFDTLPEFFRNFFGKKKSKKMPADTTNTDPTLPSEKSDGDDQ